MVFSVFQCFKRLPIEVSALSFCFPRSFRSVWHAFPSRLQSTAVTQSDSCHLFLWDQQTAARRAVPLLCAARLVSIVLGEIQSRILKTKETDFSFVEFNTRVANSLHCEARCLGFHFFFSEYPYNTGFQAKMTGIVRMMAFGVLTL